MIYYLRHISSPFIIINEFSYFSYVYQLEEDVIKIADSSNSGLKFLQGKLMKPCISYVKTLVDN